ncbi:hypothetical protein [Salinicola avicenniae]|uniref:hypothetical protein n=1 Tax=Salinicola avicenniae TaxID=2916836 RepID=UPI002073B008|nr:MULTISPECIES: hypothetical protein [unclassified Salinicola]
MESLVWLFVGQPLAIFAVAAAFLAAFLVLRRTAFGRRRHPRGLLIAALAWGLYAAWEVLVLWQTPEANIRVDLLLLWPALGLVSLWALYRALR